MNKGLINKSIYNFYEKAFPTKKYYLMCRIIRNQTYLRYKLYKNYSLMKKYEKIKLIYFFFYKKYSKLSIKLNVMINTKEYICNFYYEHFNVVINQNAIIGENLYLVGNNCIGGGYRGAPTIGKNVTLGYGATIIGDVTIADGVTIGAGAIITKDIIEPNSVYVGNNKRIK